MQACQTIEKLFFYSIFHIATVTINLFWMLENASRNMLDMFNKVFPLFWYGQFKSIIIFRQCSMEAWQTK